jgi:2-polyprenyl-3-methyl-5-hydroxy-6-metoxy-1,4-benzoquinol methylase
MQQNNILNVLIVLQTHSKGDNQQHLGFSRYCDAPKSEVQRRCTRSLIESINYAKVLFNAKQETKFQLVVYDDHSDESAIKELKNNLNLATFPTQFIPLDTYGIMPSILKCYEHGLEHGIDIVYFAQDDYLYDTNAIYDMMVTLIDTTIKLGNYSSVYPFNDPYRYYIPENTAVKSHIIQSQGRHWRTQTATASCFMTWWPVIQQEWDLFEAMGNHPIESDMEDNTINRLFHERGYYLFVPMPSLALHMQYDTEKDPYMNWREWWDRYDRPEPLQPTTEKTILNVGFGGQSISEQVFTEDLVKLNYKELSLDIDKKYNPDIIASVDDLSHLPDKFVDIVYSSHMIEHVQYFKVPIIIKELLRIVKDDGFVRLVTPNLSRLGYKLTTGDILDPMYIAEDGLPITVMDILYGSTTHTHKNNNEYMAHKCGFTKKVFENLALRFKYNIYVREVEFDLVVDIRKR